MTEGTILILGAFTPEVDLICERLHRTLLTYSLSSQLYLQVSSSKEKDDTLICSSGIEVEVIEVGVGPLAAALNLQARILAEDQPRILEIIFLGSAGLYPPEQSYGPNYYCASQEFYLHDLGVLEGRAKQPELLSSYVQTEIGPLAGYIAEKLAVNSNIDFYANHSIVINPLGISLEVPKVKVSLPILKSTYSRSTSTKKFYLENLESFGLAMTAKKYNINFCAFLAITNCIGPEASKQWQKHHRLMSVTLQQHLLSLIEL